MVKMNSERNPHLLNDPSGGGGGGGCVIGSSSSTPIHGYGSPPGVDMAVVGQPCPVPTPPWVKPPSNNSGMMTPESDVSSCSSPASSSYGASSQSAGAFPQNNPHLQHRTFYGSATSYCNANNSNPISSSTNNSASSGIFYDSSGEIVDQSQYYHHHHPPNHHQIPSPHQHHHHPQQHFQQFNSTMHLQKAGSSNNSPSLEQANMNMGGGDCGSNDSGVVSSGGGNFYGFYNANSNQSGHYADYHQQQPHQHHHHDSNSGGGGGGGDQYYQQHRQVDTSGGSTSVPVGHSNYFGSPVGTPNPNFPTSSGNATPPARYGSPMLFPNNHGSYPQQPPQLQQHHPQQQTMQGGIPVRRNSIESFSSEPGDMHGSYAARYGCANSNAMNNMNHPPQLNSGQQLNSANQQFHQQHHNSFGGNPVKRECPGMNNRGSPSMNPMTPNSNMNASGCWSPHQQQPQGGGGYFPAPSPTGGCTSSSSPNPCSNSGAPNPNRAPNFMNPHNNSNNGYNQNTCGVGGESGNCSGNFYTPHEPGHHHNPHQTTQFKSCVYEQSQQHHDIKEGIQMVGNNPGGNNLKAASAVKHRSLSLSMPLPSYMEGNGPTRSDMNSGNFINQSHPHRQLSQQNHNHPHHPHNPHQLHNNQAFNPMMSTSPHQHQQCPTTTGLVPPPEQNLLTPNSDDDIPFRAASAGGQSDMDSSYETMGDEGCSSTSTSVASHCMNTSGSPCPGVGTSNTGTSVTIANTTSDHGMHPMAIDNESDCHHHHHTHHHLLYSSPSSSTVSSCMQTNHHPHHHQHHHVASTMGMGLMGIPNSTVVGLCRSNVNDLDDSSSDSSSVELHNVISAVVENSSIETPENTMMGDEGEDDVMGGPMSMDHHNQDSLTNVNIISTTTNEADDEDVGQHSNGNEEGGGDEDDEDNCSESSMSHINSSFTADMFCSNSNSNSIMSSAADNTTTTATINNQNNNGHYSKSDAVINSSNDFLCIVEDGHFDPPDNSAASLKKSGSNSSSSMQSQFMLKTSSFSPPPQAVSSPQKISKRSFSEADKDNASFGNTGTTTSSSLSGSVVVATSLASFGASFRKNVGSIGSGGSGESSVSASHSFKKGGDDGKEDNDISERSSANDNNNFSNDNCSSNNDNSSNNNSNNEDVNNTGDISSCKAIDIIISSTNSNGSGMASGNSGNCGDKDDHRVSIPKGWKREILKGSPGKDNNNGNGSTGTGTSTTTNTTGVLYISPSDTKIRNLDELKNYIGSDGTCKCGLSCPLRLEVAFSFDPKVTNMTAEDEKENLESLNTAAISGGCGNGGKNGTSSSPSTSSSSSSGTTTASTSSSATNTNTMVPGSSSGESDSRLLCNHKRKIPKAEDSPLISSTRDDLGDFGEKLKKRRMSGNECLGEKQVSSGPFRKDPITTSASNNGSSNTNRNGSNVTNTSTSGTGSSNNASQNVPVPFCQQSPDTTTQTPQTEMSPASSVCSDSSTILFSSTGSSAGGSNNGGNRSLTSTPTPTLSSSSTSSSMSAAAAPTTKFSSSPSQGQGHCEFVWPSLPLQTGAIQLPQQQLANLNQPNTLWLNPNTSVTTFTPSPIGSSSNSLTLNYVQSPNIVGGSIGGNADFGKGLSTGQIIIGQTSLPSSNLQISKATTTTTSSSPSISTPTSAATTPAKKSNTYHPYPSKTVKRPSSPCPNIDVRQLPLEQNRPPPVSSINQTSSKLSPATSITATLSTTPGIPAPTTITSCLSALPIVTNPNILFTVTPPIMAANTSLSTPTLPILPLLTTTGKLPTVGQIDTSCGGSTIVTTLQPGTSIFNTKTLYPADTKNKEVPIIPSTKQQQQQSRKVGSTVNTSVSNSGTKIDPKKKVEESTKNPKNEKEAGPGKTQGKAKATSSTGNASGGDKSPLQLAQDIVNRFEKKSGDKTGNKTNQNKSGSSNTTPTSSKDTKADEKEKAKEKHIPKPTTKSTKDVSKAAEEKSNKDNAADVVKTDSSKPISSTQPNKADTTAGGNKSTLKAGANESETNKNSSVAKKAESKPEVEIIQLDDKEKVSTDTLKQQSQQSCAPPPISHNPVPVSNTVVTVSTQLPQQQGGNLGDNTIITSHTPVVNTTPLILKDGLQLAATDQGLTLTTSVSVPIPTISLSGLGNQLIQTSGAPVPCSTTITAGGLSTFTTTGGNQIILQNPQVSADQGNGANPTFITTSAAQGTTNLRYPILQTIQPLFLNSGHAGGPLIISQPQNPHDPMQGTHGLAQQSFIYDQNGNPTATFDATGVGAFQSMLQPTTTTMVLDPSLCAGNNLTAGGKKKKKRLSKKQQQQQAQLQFQQQLILQQIQQQQQAAALAPLTIFPQSFNLGPQGFSLQPTMNFFQQPTTFLTLPNLILNPADGTLFIQPSTPLPTATTAPMQQTTMKLGGFPLTTTTTIQQNPQNIAPKKDGSGMTTIIQNINEPLKPASTPGLDTGSDDSRQNPTPDSSTNDLQLGLINVATTPQSNTITLNIPAPNTTTVLHNPSPVVNKKNSKSRTVSSSGTTVKRILPQKQILPKIDSTTPSTTENAS